MQLQKTFLIFFLSILTLASAHAQEEEATQWVPGLLNAKASTIYTLSSYYGYPIGWKPRANRYQLKMIIDGIDWASSLPGFNANMMYSGVYETSAKGQLVENFAYSENGFGNPYNTQYFSSFSNAKRKQKKINWTTSNNARLGAIGYSWITGRTKTNWTSQTYLHYQNQIHNNPSLGFKKSFTAAISFDKILQANQSLHFLMGWKMLDQSKKAMISHEIAALAKDKEYNPLWGWFHGAVWYPNTRKNQTQHFQVTYVKQFLNGGFLQGSIGLVTGLQRENTLEWTATKDPRPDYYKYMPSYYQDSNLQERIRLAFKENPLRLQLQGDALEKINLSSADGRSYFIVNASNARPYFFKSNWDYSTLFFKTLQVDWHISFSRATIHYYNQIDQLLGGKYFYNYNTWVDDEGNSDFNQFDIQAPNRKIRQNEKWGPDYILIHQNLKYDQQLQWTRAKWEWSLGLSIGTSFFQRIGNQQNGLFPTSSFGKSDWFPFPYGGLKAQALYKISGRHYIQAIIFQQSEAPNGTALFLDPSLQNTMALFQRPLGNKGIDLSYKYRGVPLQSNISFYTAKEEGLAGHQFFYHDYYHAFVYGEYGQASIIKTGIECSLETLLKGMLEIKAVAAYSYAAFVNQPLYQILLANNLFQVESGVLRIKNLPASTSPNFVTALSIASSLGLSSKLGITGIVALDRAIAYDYYRRSLWGLSKMGALQESILAVPYYPNQCLLDIYFTSFIYFKHNSQLRWSLHVKNALNNKGAIWASEQTRFDYINYHAEKFPVKYFFDQGISISAQIQYLFP